MSGLSCPSQKSIRSCRTSLFSSTACLNLRKAWHLAGVDGALRGYEAIHKKDTSYRVPHLDDLIQKRDQGKLTDYVHATAKKCK
jgi:hypothetical protein